jgi:signal transduction histidine kinase
MAAGETALNVTGEPERLLASRELVHEFRNLLAVIINYCELIAEETSDPEAIKNDLNEIRTAAERALALTERIPVPPRQPSPGSADAGE